MTAAKASLLDRHRSLQIAARDKRLSDLDCRVLARITFYVNSDSGRAWPAADKLAGEIECTMRSARRALHNLLISGYLEKVEGGGGRDENGKPKTAVYTMRILPKEKPLTVTPGSSLSTVTPGSSMTPGSANGDPVVLPTVTLESPDEVDKNSTNDEDDKSPALPGLGIDPLHAWLRDEFQAFAEQWWNVFPKRRRANEAGVTAKLRKIIASGEATPEQLAKACAAYAASEDACKEDGRYAKAPLAWLNDRRWQIDYRPAQSGRSAVSDAFAKIHRERQAGNE